MNTMKFRCYVCGNDIGDKFLLASMTDTSTDRVFIVHEEKRCADRLESEVGIMRVKAQTAKRTP